MFAEFAQSRNCSDPQMRSGYRLRALSLTKYPRFTSTLFDAAQIN